MKPLRPITEDVVVSETMIERADLRARARKPYVWALLNAETVSLEVDTVIDELDKTDKDAESDTPIIRIRPKAS